MGLRIFYAAGPGDIIGAHRNWREGKDDPTQMSLTYSGQFEDLCQDLDATAYLISSNASQQYVRDGRFTLEHRPKRALGGGPLYHLSEILYGITLLATARRFRADLAVISSGTTHYFMLSLFRLCRIPVITVLHNTIWPKGHPPVRLVQRTIRWLDSLFFRWMSTASIGISSECTKQVAELSGHRTNSLHVMYPQFRRSYFQGIPPAPSIEQSPFNIVFAGRVERNKGVFDMLQMARRIQEKLPGRVHWEICGSGADLEELKQQHNEMQLQSVVSIRGWTSPADLRVIQGSSHLSIVPTRSSFAEGMAKTALEAVLAGRPVLTSSVTPALDVLRSASIEAQADDVESYVEAILSLLADERRYLALVGACSALQDQFYDGDKGFRAVLKRTIAENRRMVFQN